MQRLTSGTFPVEFAGNGTTLYLFVSSFDHTARRVRFAVHEAGPDGRKTVLQGGTMPVPPFEAASRAFTDLEGRTVEVVLDIPNPALKPSLSLIGRFVADGAQQILFWLSPARFQPLTAGREPSFRGVSGVRRRRPRRGAEGARR